MRNNKHLRSVFVVSMVNVALETRLISTEEKSHDLVDCKLMSKTFRLLISEAPCVLVEIYRRVGRKHILCPQHIRMMTQGLPRFPHLINLY